MINVETPTGSLETIKAPYPSNPSRRTIGGLKTPL